MALGLDMQISRLPTCIHPLMPTMALLDPYPTWAGHPVTPCLMVLAELISPAALASLWAPVALNIPVTVRALVPWDLCLLITATADLNRLCPWDLVVAHPAFPVPPVTLVCTAAPLVQ